MNAVNGTMLCLAVAMGALACSAQDATIPIRQIERDAQLSWEPATPGSEAAVSHSNGIPSGSSSSAAGFVLAPPAYKAPRTLSRGFFLMNGLHLGMAAFDVAMSQRCIADHQCREGNPLMPSSLAGQLSANFAYVGWGTFVSYRLKRHGSKLWWLSPTVGIASHAVGVASGFAH
jgi:hypothetical protein